MRAFCASLLLVLFASACICQQPQSSPENEQTGNVTEIIRDGGVSQVLQSIYIPPIKGAPFTAIVHTEWIRPLPDGGTFTVVNQRQVARDSTGRIYEERWLLVPKDGKMPSQMNVIEIADPVAHTLDNCFTLRTPHRCLLETLRESAMDAYRPSMGQTGPLPNGDGFRTHEDLGMQTFSGIDCQGTRDTTTINPGVFGNDRPFNRKREFWFAASLGIDLRSEITDPSFGKEVFTVTDVNTSEPDPKLFELPEGYAVVDQRRPAASNEQAR